jgi:porin
VRAGFAPVDRNALSWVVDSGVAVTGLLPGRPSDVASLGLVFDRFSPRFSSHARALDPASPAPDFEHVVELNYSAALTERVSLQPDFQFIRHPGGSALRRDACLFLLRVKAPF